MINHRKEVESLYGNRLRNRVCGICTSENKILVIKHLGVGSKGYLLAPPGGGLEYGSSIENNLKREFKEETGLDVTIGEFLFINEYINKPIHTLELFFRVEIKGGKLEKGYDPEMAKESQIIEEVKFIDYNELKEEDNALLHNSFTKFNSLEELLNFKGYLLQSL